MAAAPIDMRRSFDGLCATVIEVLEQNPLEGHLFLFRGKRGDRIKALIWDRNGLAICMPMRGAIRSGTSTRVVMISSTHCCRLRSSLYRFGQAWRWRKLLGTF